MPRSDVLISNRQTLLREAANWLVRLDNGKLNAAERREFKSWCQSSPEHERIWEIACKLNRNFSQLPNNLAKPVLGRSRMTRRALLKTLASVGLLAPLSWTLVRQQPWQPWLADYQSAVGERRSFILSDGSELILNTDTALDVQFTADQRIVRLHRGEVFVRTGKDLLRSFSVVTDQGSIRALGTEFAVRCLADATQVTVVQKSVLAAPRSGIDPLTIEQGMQCRFTAQHIEFLRNMPNNSLSWRQGELIVDNWRLDAFVRELGRYRSGILRCDANVAGLKISGVFQTDNTNQALDVLAQMFDLEITRYTDYWVSIGKAAA